MEFLSVYNYLLDEHLRHLKTAAHRHEHPHQPSVAEHHHNLQGDAQLLHQHLWQPWKAAVEAAAAADDARNDQRQQLYLHPHDASHHHWIDPRDPEYLYRLHQQQEHQQQQHLHHQQHLQKSHHQQQRHHNSHPNQAMFSPSAASATIRRAESRLTTKELPTTKWRRDRRVRLSAEYHQPSSPTSAASAAASAAAVRPLSESNGVGIAAANAAAESPLDMSGKPPPPPYREPLPGSQFAHHLARPSVITQAPKRDAPSATSPGIVTAAASPVMLQLANQENSGSAVARSPAVAAVSPSSAKSETASTAAAATALNESISMIDPVIDEHFRRSLGADYAALFGNNRKPGAAIKPTPITAPKKQQLQQLPSIAVTATVMAAHAGSSSGGSSANSPAIAVATVSPTMAAISPVVAQQTQQQNSPNSTIASSASGSSATVTSPLSAIVAPTVRSSPSAASAPMRQQQRQQQQQQQQPPPPSNSDVTDDVGMSVDDHFAKALGGDTWKQLQRAESRNEEMAASAAAAAAAATGHSNGPSRTRVKHEAME